MQWIDFLNRFVRTPRQVGSVTPSSVFLARTIVSGAPWERCRVVAELGAGTGAITRAIEECRRPGSRFHVFEVDSDFRQALSRDFPEIILHGDAMEVDQALRSAGDAEADVIVSCLPLTLMREKDREALFASISNVLAHDGLFVAYQYTPLLGPMLRRHFRLVDVRFAPLNIPPAFVYYCGQPVSAAAVGRSGYAEVAE